MSATSPPKLAAAWNDLAELMADMPNTHLHPSWGYENTLDIVEGYRSASHLLRVAFELILEGDPERPRFTEIVGPERKLLGDNPDARYHWCRIRGDRAYRIRGTMDRQVYVSFTIHGRDPTGGSTERVVTDVNHIDLGIPDKGYYELILSAERPDDESIPWVPLEPDAATIVVRHYFTQPVCAQNDTTTIPYIHIEPVVDPGPPPPLSDEILGERMAEVVQWMRRETLDRSRPDEPSRAPFSSPEDNKIGTPMTYRQTGLPGWGAVDIHYAAGKFLLEPDEAIVMEGRIPPCLYANVCLWNIHMQSLDYRHHQISFNLDQIQLDDDGRFRVVIAHADPGVPNWLDTAGHRTGHMYWRFMLAEEDPETPVCRVVKLVDVS